MKKVTVVGAGYVGLSIAVLLSQNNEVILTDVDQARVDAINQSISPIQDKEISAFMSRQDFHLPATTNFAAAVKNADFIILALPTAYDASTKVYDTSVLDAAIEEAAAVSPSSLLVVKSTVPTGYTKSIYQANKNINIVFSPEFLREGNALYDNLHPFRIIVGVSNQKSTQRKQAQQFIDLIVESAVKKDIPSLIMPSTEAEAVKLFSNAFHAMRLAFFNELDTYSETKKLNAKNILEGVCMDSRIGQHHNNPSFGYGYSGLPKGTMQLLAEFEETPGNMVSAVVESNEARIQHIVSQVLARQPQSVGIYRLAANFNIDKMQETAIFKIIQQLKKHGIDITIYEPELTPNKTLLKLPIEYDLEIFKESADLIIANRTTLEIEDAASKIYTRDLYHIG